MSVGELREVLRIVEEHLQRSLGQIGAGRTALSEATAALARIDPNNPQTVVPPEAHRADEQLDRVREQVEHTLDTLRDYSARI